MPARVDCQGLVRFFSKTLNTEKTDTYKNNSNKCFKLLVKKMTFL